MAMIPFVIFALLGVLSAWPMERILNSMPAKCFCDYDETPDERHNPPRISKKQRLVSSLLLGVMFAMVYGRFGFSVRCVALCLFCLVLVMIALSDLRFSIIPDELLIAGCLLAMVSGVSEILGGNGLFEKLSPALGGILGALIILGINLLGRLLYKKDALGMGDLKLMAVCGIACGTTGVLIAMLIGVLSAGIFFAVGMALKKVSSEEYLPLGPFLVLGTAVTICFRPAVDALLAWYVSLL